MARLTREERDAVRGEVLADLAGIADLTDVVERGDYATARALRERADDSLLLMDGLGWEADPRQAFELTVPPQRLLRVVGRLHRSAAGALSQEVLNIREESPPIGRSALAVRAYAAVLAAIEQDARPDKSAP